VALDASTNKIWQFGQTALTMSRSREISCVQLPLDFGRLLVPVWPTLRKQPFAVVQGWLSRWCSLGAGFSLAGCCCPLLGVEALMRCLALSAVRPCRARLFRAAQPVVQHPAIGAFRWATILGLIDAHGCDPSRELSGENSEEAVGVRNEATARYESCAGILRFDRERHVQRKSMPLTSRNRPLLLKQFQWSLSLSSESPIICVKRKWKSDTSSVGRSGGWSSCAEHSGELESRDRPDVRAKDGSRLGHGRHRRDRWSQIGRYKRPLLIARSRLIATLCGKNAATYAATRPSADRIASSKL